MTRPLRFAALGIDHSHIFGMAQNMIDAGADFVGWWTEGTPDTLDSFVGRFPEVPRVASKEDIFADDGIDLILIAAIPADRVETRWTGERQLTVATGDEVAAAANRVVDIAIH